MQLFLFIGHGKSVSWPISRVELAFFLHLTTSPFHHLTTTPPHHISLVTLPPCVHTPLRSRTLAFSVLPHGLIWLMMPHSLLVSCFLPLVSRLLLLASCFSSLASRLLLLASCLLLLVSCCSSLFFHLLFLVWADTNCSGLVPSWLFGFS